MHWLGSRLKRLLLAEGSLSSNISDLVSEKPSGLHRNLRCVAVNVLLKTRSGSGSRQLRSGPAHAPSSLHNIMLQEE